MTDPSVGTRSGRLSFAMGMVLLAWSLNTAAAPAQKIPDEQAGPATSASRTDSLSRRVSGVGEKPPPRTTTLSPAPKTIHDQSSLAGARPEADSASHQAAADSASRKTFAHVMINSTPAGAEVFIDDSLAGTTPFKTDTLSAGSHVIRLTAEGYQEFRKVDQFAALSRRKIIVHLISLFASLSVRSLPPGATISLNGISVGTTPFDTARLAPGAYAIVLDKPAYLPYQAAINALQNKHDTVTAQLVSKAYRDSLAAIAKKNRRIARRVLFGTGASLFALAGLIENGDASGHLNKESDALTAYNRTDLTADQFTTNWNQYQSEQKNADKAMRARNVLYGIAGVFIAAFAISIPF